MAPYDRSTSSRDASYKTLDTESNDQGVGRTDLNPLRHSLPRSWYFNLLPVLGLAYLGHVRYRRYSPRRLPTFTSMKVGELYAGHVLTTAIQGVGDELEKEVFNDPDLEVIERMARTVKSLTLDKSLIAIIDSRLDTDERLRRALLEIRSTTYHQPGLTNKLIWWHNHAWSTERTWLRAAVIWAAYVRPDQSPAGFDACVTHIANTCQGGSDYEYMDYGHKIYVPFLLSIPLAMLARWTRRPALFLPMNGLQRVFWWTTAYLNCMQHFQHYAYVRSFRNQKRELVQMIREGGLSPPANAPIKFRT